MAQRAARAPVLEAYIDHKITTAEACARLGIGPSALSRAAKRRRRTLLEEAGWKSEEIVHVLTEIREGRAGPTRDAKGRVLTLGRRAHDLATEFERQGRVTVVMAREWTAWKRDARLWGDHRYVKVVLHREGAKFAQVFRIPPRRVDHPVFGGASVKFRNERLKAPADMRGHFSAHVGTWRMNEQLKRGTSATSTMEEWDAIRKCADALEREARVRRYQRKSTRCRPGEAPTDRTKRM